MSGIIPASYFGSKCQSKANQIMFYEEHLPWDPRTDRQRSLALTAKGGSGWTYNFSGLLNFMTLRGNTIKWLSCICKYYNFSQYGIARMQDYCTYIVHVWFFLLIFRSTPCRLNVSFNEFPNARCVGLVIKLHVHVLTESQSSIEIQSCIK